MPRLNNSLSGTSSGHLSSKEPKRAEPIHPRYLRRRSRNFHQNERVRNSIVGRYDSFFRWTLLVGNASTIGTSYFYDEPVPDTASNASGLHATFYVHCTPHLRLANVN